MATERADDRFGFLRAWGTQLVTDAKGHVPLAWVTMYAEPGQTTTFGLADLDGRPIGRRHGSETVIYFPTHAEAMRALADHLDAEE